MDLFSETISILKTKSIAASFVSVITSLRVGSNVILLVLCYIVVNVKIPINCKNNMYVFSHCDTPVISPYPTVVIVVVIKYAQVKYILK